MFAELSSRKSLVKTVGERIPNNLEQRRIRPASKEFLINVVVFGAVTAIDAVTTGAGLQEVGAIQERMEIMKSFLENHGIEGLYLIKALGVAGVYAGLEYARRIKEEPTINFARGVNILMSGVALNNALLLLSSQK